MRQSSSTLKSQPEVHATRHSTVTDEHGQPQERTQLLSLPLELRNKIYRGLLTAQDTNQKKYQWFIFYPAVLRVSKQIYAEGSKVLYEENLWVMSTFNFRSLPSWLHYDYGPTFNITRDVSQLGDLPFGREPAVRIDVRSQQQNVQCRKSGTFPKWFPQPQTRIQQYLLTPMHGTEATFRGYLDLFEQKGIEELEFSVSLGDLGSKQQQCQDVILDYLADFRGVRKARIRGMQPDSVNEATATSMMTPINNIQEILARGCTYQRRAERALMANKNHPVDLDHGYRFLDYRDAHSPCWFGLQYLNQCQKAFVQSHKDVKPNYVKQQLFSLKMVLLKGFVTSTVKKGDGYNWVLDHEDGISDHQKAVAYYEEGLECRSQGQDKSAAFAFLQAYALHPGWEAADQELDALQRSLVYWKPPVLGWSLEDWNLGGILQGFRYRTELQTS